MTTSKSPYPTHLPCSICGELIEIDKRYRSRARGAVHPECQERADGVEPSEFMKYLRENREKIHEMWESIREREKQNGDQ